MKDQLLIDVTHPVLRDHVVHGRNLLPGLGYIDLLYQVFRDHGHDPATLALRNLSIHAPLSVGQNEQLVLTVEWTPLRDDAWEVTLDGGGQRYATAQMHHIAVPSFDETLDLDAVRRSARTTVDASEIYEGFRGRGLVHSGLMKAEGTLYVTDDALYVDVALSAEGLESADALIFHPALIDGSAVIAGGMLDPASQRLNVPLFFESFRASTLLQRRCFARIAMASVRRRNELSYLTIEMFDEQGRKVAELTNLGCRELKAEESGGDATALQNAIRTLIAGKLGIAVERVRDDRTFAEMGLVSRDLLELARVIEGWVGETLSPALLFEYTTVTELAAFLENKGAGGTPARQPAGTPAVSGAEGIAIIGIDGRFPGAANVGQLWDNLAAGVDCITEVPADRWDASLMRCRWGGFIDGVDEFDPLFFSISPAEAKLMDPQGRLFLQTVWNLLEANGHTRATLQSEYAGRVGVYVGSMYQHYSAPDSDPVNHSMTSISSYSAIANRVSYFFGLTGPSIAVDTMCSSSATAIHMACKDLLLGECELAIAGGVNLSIHPKKYLGLSQAQLIASGADSRSFGEGDGYLPAETVGAVLLKTLSKAIADGDPILAVIKASAVNHGGRANGYTVPNPNAQAQLIEEVLTKARVDARTVSYVEAAANGATSGDWIEIAALSKAFGRYGAERQSVAIGSVKSNIGHAEAASGISQIAKVVAQMQRGVIAPSIKADPERLGETPFVLQKELGEWKRPVVEGREWPRRAIVNSFGAGGAYASLLLEEHVATTHPKAAALPPHSIVLSARNEERLRAVVQHILEYVEEHEEISLADLAYTLHARREAMECGIAFAADNREELVRAMRAYLAGEELPAVEAPKHVAAANILTLPTYPFARERYWLPVEASEVDEPGDDSVRGFITTFLSRALDIPAQQIDPARNLQAYGMDSIVAMRLARALEQRFETPVTGRVLFEHQTVDALTGFLESRFPTMEPATAGADDLAIELLEQFRRGALTSSEIEALIHEGAIV